MFFQRRRLQVLCSVLIIVTCSVFLLGQLQPQRAVVAPYPGSQLSEAVFYLRNNYVRVLEEGPLLESAVLALQKEAAQRGLPEDQMPDWATLPRSPGEDGLIRTEQYLARVGAIDPTKFPLEEAVYVGISGMLSSLGDPYTYAMDPSAYRKFQQSLHTHSYGGVGIELEWTQGAYVVFEVAPDSPAEQARILPGDRLWTVDGVELSPPGRPAVTLHQARALLEGEIGAPVKLVLSRQGARYSRVVTLGQFQSRSVRGRLVGEPEFGEPRVGWVRVASLGEDTGQELVETVALLSDQGAQGFVLDLRDNVGGYLNAAVDIASYWLPSGLPVVTVEGRQAEKARHTVGAVHQKRSLVVLMNSRTASSAEILAASLREHGRAYLLGEQTFGKGSVQTLYDFADGGGFKMTTATYLTPSGQSVEGQGLRPDRAVDVTQGRDDASVQQDVLKLCGELWTTDPTEP